MDLPETEDPTYKSYHSLLRHVFKWSREYMSWICEKLDLPDPRIESIPDSESIESRGSEYMEHLFERWRSQLTNIPKEKFFNPTFLTPWKVDYSIEAMLEHAVMHPIRHRFQLLELLDENLK